MRLLNAVFLVTLNLRNSKIDKIKDIAEVDATGRYIAPVGVREDLSSCTLGGLIIYRQRGYHSSVLFILWVFSGPKVTGKQKQDAPLSFCG